MDRSLWVAKTGLESQQTRMAVISNNLANVSTVGFKRTRANFEDLIYQNVRQAGAQSSEDTVLPSGLMLGSGVRTVSTEKIHAQGNMIITDNPYDIAVQGRGFFQTLLPSGEIAYTRDGAFSLNGAGQMVNSSGYPLQPAITIPENARSVTIGTDGIVTVMQQGDVAPVQVGNLETIDFINPGGLQPMGENMYLETVASGAPQAGTPGLQGLGSLIQGSLESSNVNVVEELVNMIETQRAYEMNSKAISTTDSMLGYLSNNL